MLLLVRHDLIKTAGLFEFDNGCYRARDIERESHGSIAPIALAVAILYKAVSAVCVPRQSCAVSVLFDEPSFLVPTCAIGRCCPPSRCKGVVPVAYGGSASLMHPAIRETYFNYVFNHFGSTPEVNARWALFWMFIRLVLLRTWGSSNFQSPTHDPNERKQRIDPSKLAGERPGTVFLVCGGVHC